MDRQGRLLQVNEAYCRMAGLERREALGRSILDLVVGLRAEEVEARHHQVELAGWSRFIGELRTRDGRPFPVEVQITWIPQLDQTYVLQQPLSGPESRFAPASQGSRFQRLIEQQGDGFTIVDGSERITFANPAGEAIFGAAPGTLVGRSLEEFLDPDQLRLVQEKTNDRKSGKEGSYELRIRRSDGTSRLLYVTVTRELDPEGNYLGSVGVFRDISDQRRAEERLRASETRFRTLLEDAPMAIVMARDRRILDVNRRFLELFGFEDGAELIGQPDAYLIHPGDRPLFDELAASVGNLSGVFRKVSFRALRRDGGELQMQVWLRTLDLEDGIATLGFCEDISIQRKAEEDRERLVQELTRALAEVRQLSGLLPICATCKKIRDDQGQWSPMEAYISSHSEADFTHGICPECAKAFRSDFRMG